MPEDSTIDTPEKTLATIRSLLSAIETISTALTEISRKRVTLEEKMISKYLHELAAAMSRCVADIHSFLTECGSADHLSLLDRQVAELLQIADEVDETTSELLKMARYDWNYLEQYYEHDFYAKLSNNHKFIARLEKAIGPVRDALSASH